MSKKPNRRSPSKFYAGSPEHGGDSLTKLVIFYGPGSKPPRSRPTSRHLSGRDFHDAPAGFATAMQKQFGLTLMQWCDPFYSYDWGKRRSKETSSIDMERGIEGLKILHRGQLGRYDVQYAVIAEAKYKGAYLLHWTAQHGWVTNAEFYAYKNGNQTTNPAAKIPTLFSAWICLTPRGQHHRRQQSQSNNFVFFGNTDTKAELGEWSALQSLVAQCNQRLLPDWKDLVERIVVYRKSDNQEVGRIQFAHTSFKLFLTDKRLASICHQISEMVMEDYP